MKRYLRHQSSNEFEALKILLPEIIKNHNEVRPHGWLNGLTPLEAYTNPDSSLDFKEQFQQAKNLRIAQNRKQNCLTFG
jgi:transposase InsO family protein